MAVRLNSKDAAKLGLTLATPREPGMNRGEAAYAAHLETLRRAGQILRWDFEPVKFRLADRTFYTPDFRIVLPDMTLTFDDIKGRKKGGAYDPGDGYGCWVEEDSILKLKVAAEMHPHRFRLVWPKKGGGWNYREV